MILEWEIGKSDSIWTTSLLKFYPLNFLVLKYFVLIHGFISGEYEDLVGTFKNIICKSSKR